jgi:hypothetical protein
VTKLSGAPNLELPQAWAGELCRRGWRHGAANAVYVFWEASEYWLRFSRLQSGRWTAALLCKVTPAARDAARLRQSHGMARAIALDHEKKQAHEDALRLWHEYEPWLQALGAALVAVDVRIGTFEDRGAYRLTALQVRREQP